MDVVGWFEVRNTLLLLALTKTALRGRVGALGDADGRLKVRQEVCHLLSHLRTELLTLSLAAQLLGQSAPSVEHLPLKTPGWECKQKVLNENELVGLTIIIFKQNEENKLLKHPHTKRLKKNDYFNRTIQNMCKF